MTDKELEELLEKVDDIRRSVAMLIKEELDRKSDRQKGPAKGQTYWFAHIDYADSYTYDADYFDSDVFRFRGIYPERRFAEAELKANELIQAVNRRRRELNEGKEFDEYKFCIVFTSISEVSVWVPSRSLYDRGLAYPFGLFKDSLDCETCINEFEDELDWFFRDYFPIMEELDDYDWADAPGWGESKA